MGFGMGKVKEDFDNKQILATLFSFILTNQKKAALVLTDIHSRAQGGYSRQVIPSLKKTGPHSPYS